MQHSNDDERLVKKRGGEETEKERKKIRESFTQKLCDQQHVGINLSCPVRI